MWRVPEGCENSCDENCHKDEQREPAPWPARTVDSMCFADKSSHQYLYFVRFEIISQSTMLFRQPRCFNHPKVLARVGIRSDLMTCYWQSSLMLLSSAIKIILICTIVLFIRFNILQAEEFHVDTSVKFQNTPTNARRNGEADTYQSWNSASAISLDYWAKNLSFSDGGVKNIEIKRNFSESEEVYSFKQSEVIFGLCISGSIQLNNDNSLVRIILVDDKFNEYLIYESYPLLISNNIYFVTNACEETCLFVSH